MQSMKATRRRKRQPDALASRAAVSRVMSDFRASLPESISKKNKEIISLLRAAVYYERSPGAVSRRGRKSPWSEDEIRTAAGNLRQVLLRGTYTVGMRSFVEHYLLIPEFPEDVVRPLERGEINLFEAEQLARLASKRTGPGDEEQLRERRSALLRTHLQSGESGIRLKARVDALLRQFRNPAASERSLPLASPERNIASAFEIELASFSQELSPDHFFYEYLQMIGSYMREIRADEIPAQAMERLLFQSEQLIEQLHSIHKQQNPPAESSGSEKNRKTFHL
jgi:hypothetical protein